MVQLKGKVELAESLEPEEGETYTITAVEEVKTAVQGFTGIRVVMKSVKKSDEKNYATMLWMREVAGAGSKLGAFIKAFKEFFGDEEQALNTDSWKGHQIRLLSWKSRKREIRVIQ